MPKKAIPASSPVQSSQAAPAVTLVRANVFDGIKKGRKTMLCLMSFLEGRGPRSFNGIQGEREQLDKAFDALSERMNSGAIGTIPEFSEFDQTFCGYRPEEIEPQKMYWFDQIHFEMNRFAVAENAAF